MTERYLNPVTIDLSNGLTDYRVALSGNFLYVDPATNGTGTLKLDSLTANELVFYPGLVIDTLEFKDIFINAPAQPGTKFNAVCGKGFAIRPAASDVRLAPVFFDSFYSVFDPFLTAGTVNNTLVAAASNTRGIRVNVGAHNAFSRAAGDTAYSRFAANNGVILAELFATGSTGAANQGSPEVFPAFFIPPGYALLHTYVNVGGGDTAFMHAMLNYRVL